MQTAGKQLKVQRADLPDTREHNIMVVRQRADDCHTYVFHIMFPLAQYLWITRTMSSSASAGRVGHVLLRSHRNEIERQKNCCRVDPSCSYLILSVRLRTTRRYRTHTRPGIKNNEFNYRVRHSRLRKRAGLLNNISVFPSQRRAHRRTRANAELIGAHMAKRHWDSAKLHDTITDLFRDFGVRLVPVRTPTQLRNVPGDTLLEALHIRNHCPGCPRARGTALRRCIIRWALW